MRSDKLLVYAGEGLAAYHFGVAHPFGPQRHDAFYDEFSRRGLDEQVRISAPAGAASRQQLALFHTQPYIERVVQQSKTGEGYLDCGDTPAVQGIYEAACCVVGTALEAVDRIMAGDFSRVFIPIAGLHHARRDSAGGFCVFNDCGVVIEHLKKHYGIQCLAYVDIDAHHGDGVYYEFESDPCLVFADLHEDGRFLYPGTGRESEQGSGAGKGKKLNIPMPPGADDAQMKARWDSVEALLNQFRPEFILLQCGVDSLAGDPITDLEYSEKAHAYAAERLCRLAMDYGHDRVLAMGGGGYNLANIARGWNAVVEAMLSA